MTLPTGLEIQRNWYSVYTAANHEKRVVGCKPRYGKQTWQQRIGQSAIPMIIETTMPRERLTRS